MKVIIIAAGSGTRLGDLTKNTPKGLMNINGKTIIERQIEMYRKKNLNDIIIIVGPNKEKFKFKNVKYVVDKEHKHHDVISSLMIAKDFMNSKLLITYSDILFDELILEQMLKFDGDIGIGTDFNWEHKYKGRTLHPLSEADNVLIKRGHVVKTGKNLVEHLDQDNLGEFIGMFILSKKGAKKFVETHKKLVKIHTGKFHDSQSYEKAIPTDIFQELIEQGFKISPVIVSGNWVEIDTLQDLENAKKVLA